MDTTIYIIRHGQSVANRDRVVSGQLETPLTELGRKQAKLTANLLMDVAFDAAYSSHLERAHETAGIVLDQKDIKITKMSELSERSYGALEGMPSEEHEKLKKLSSKAYFALSPKERWRTKLAADMESDGELSDRFLAALQQIGQNHPGQTILVGSHAGPIRTTLIALGHSTEEEMPAGGFSNCGYIQLQHKNDNLKVTEVYNPSLKELGVE